jgi:hypothetical protein
MSSLNQHFCFLFSGKVWIKQMLLSAFLMPACVCGTAFFINFIAIYYHASRAIPFGTMVRIIQRFVNKKVEQKHMMYSTFKAGWLTKPNSVIRLELF